MLTDEQAQELQAANAALRAALDSQKRVLADHLHSDTLLCRQDLERLIQQSEAVLAADAGRARLALERATVKALQERVHGEEAYGCHCKQCRRDRELLAQWDALGVEGTP